MAGPPETVAAAMQEWRASSKNPWRYRPVNPGREMRKPSPELWSQYARELGELRKRMSCVPVEDRHTWVRVAKETASAFAALVAAG